MRPIMVIMAQEIDRPSGACGRRHGSARKIVKDDDGAGTGFRHPVLRGSAGRKPTIVEDDAVAESCAGISTRGLRDRPAALPEPPEDVPSSLPPQRCSEGSQSVKLPNTKQPGAVWTTTALWSRSICPESSS